MRWTHPLALGLLATLPQSQAVVTLRASLRPNNLRQSGAAPGVALALDHRNSVDAVRAASIAEADDALESLRAPKRPTLNDGQMPPQEASRLHSILNIGESVEDFEVRQKPPFASIPGQEVKERMTEQQREGGAGIFDSPPDDFQDCILIHQYAEPLNVIDAFEIPEPGLATVSMSSHELDEQLADTKEASAQKLPNKMPDEEEEDEEHHEVGKSIYARGVGKVFVRPGAIYDSATRGGQELHLGLQMYANLEGITNPVQVVPHGPVSRWSSKWRVPIAGFLCLHQNKSDSAPVLHASPTPCVPTTLDAEGNALSAMLDKYEVFIGTTRLAFDNKEQAERFCLAYAEEIARDLSTTVWDAEQLKFAMPSSEDIEDAPPAMKLAVGDICYRFCEDGSEPPVNLRSLCPADAPCSSPLTPDMMAYDQCGAHAHTCGGVSTNANMTPPVVPTAPPTPAPPTAAPAAAPAPAVAPAVAPSPAPAAPNSTTGPAAPLVLNVADSEAAAAEAEAAAALAESGLPPTAFGQQPPEAATAAMPRLRHHHHHRHHKKHLAKTSLVQLAANSTLLSEADRRHHHHRKNLAEARLLMAAGKRSVHRNVQDVVEKGQRSLSTIRNPDLLSFIVKSRKRTLPQGWTFGTKKLLVVIMDWKEGDNSMSPYSKQDDNPIPHYQNKIFPEVQRRFSQMSYGQFGLDVTIVPEVVRYTRDRNTIPGRLPFPSLYNEAREAVQGHPRLGGTFAFREYDLVYVIHPQVAPVGTKGVAWVGSRGASCNGCETISDSFKIMVAVHELGHNLGLSHASSEALEYGNPFDWMGNYPDVVGLHYGLGYKNELGWIRDSSLLEVTDANVDTLNDMVTLTPFDSEIRPQTGQVVGVRISLKDNAEDIYLSFRSTALEKHRGLYVVYQSKDSPNSKLMDAACHSPSQQDAYLRVGWTYMDGSQKVVVKVVEETKDTIKVHVYRTPDKSGAVAGIRARKDFTDGRTKCPLTCQDSDLIISQSCASLKDDGYCTGTMRLQGNKLRIGTEVCPVTCGNCKEVLSESPELGRASCEDKNVKISGMDCSELVERKLCDAKTTSGKTIGDDLCRKSCGSCPKPPPSSKDVDASDFPDPKPARHIGGDAGGDACPAGCRAPTMQPGSPSNGGLDLQGNICIARASQRFGDVRYCGTGGAYAAGDSLDCSSCRAEVAPLSTKKMCPWMCMAPVCTHGSNINGGLALAGDRCLARCSNAYGEQRFCGKGGVYEEPGSIDCTGCVGDGVAAAMKEYTDSVAEALEHPEAASSCEDDDNWVDIDGHDCESYRNTVPEWGRDHVCFKHRDGIGAVHCRATCGTCKEESASLDTCVDNACIGPWMQAYGRCFQCADYARACEDEDTRSVFHVECPMTCGVCKPASKADLKVEEEDKKDEKEEKEEDDDEHDKKDKKKNKEKALQKKCEDEDKDLCKDLGMRYCSERKFAKRCKKTCDLCPPEGAEKEPECKDLFSSYTCARYESYGWCEREDTREAVRIQCPSTCGVCSEAVVLPGNQTSREKAREEKKAKAKESHAWRSADASAALRWLLLAVVVSASAAQ